MIWPLSETLAPFRFPYNVEAPIVRILAVEAVIWPLRTALAPTTFPRSVEAARPVAESVARWTPAVAKPIVSVAA